MHGDVAEVRSSESTIRGTTGDVGELSYTMVSIHKPRSTKGPPALGKLDPQIDTRARSSRDLSRHATMRTLPHTK